jgi:hypothetical protein
MSRDISSTVDDAKRQNEEDIEQNVVPSATDEKNDSSENFTAETAGKTPISSATPLSEPIKNKVDEPLPLQTESFESTEPTGGFNETECVKFAEKLYKVS